MRKTIFKKLEAKRLITNYNSLRKNLPRKIPKKIIVWDETLAESVRSPTVFLTYVEKVKLAKMMDELGIPIITVGYPGFSNEEKHDIRRLANEEFIQVRLAAYSSLKKNDIDACLECGIREMLLCTPFNGLNLKYKLKTSPEQIIGETAEAIEYAKSRTLTVNFVLEDASRTPLEEMLKIFNVAIEAGADRLVFADTTGFLRPLSMRYIISHIKKNLSKLSDKEVPLAVYCYNDFGLATANTLTAIEEGIAYVHTGISGFGKRAGIAPTEEVVTALELLYNIDTDIDVRKINKLSQLVEKSLALPIQYHKPIVGKNAFAHEIDEYFEDVLAHQILSVPFPPQMVGRDMSFYLGRIINRELIKSWLQHVGIKATRSQLDEIARRTKYAQERHDKGGTQMTFYQIKKLMKEMEKGFSEENFWKIVKQVTKQTPSLQLKKKRTRRPN